jgi:hypothetical protein
MSGCFRGLFAVLIAVITLPPAQYDYIPQGIRTFLVPARAADIFCRAISATPHEGHHLGCMLSDNPCIVVVGNVTEWSIILRHEAGHCNGWPAHHPGARV